MSYESFQIVSQRARALSFKPATEKQLRQFNIELSTFLKGHKKQRALRMALLSLMFGRPFSSSAELTKGEARAFFDEIYNPRTTDRFCADIRNAVCQLENAMKGA